MEGAGLPQRPWLFPLNLVSLPVGIWERLQNVADLRVSPSRILLLFRETELSLSATPTAIQLRIADVTVVLSEASRGHRDIPAVPTPGAGETPDVGDLTMSIFSSQDPHAALWRVHVVPLTQNLLL